MKNVRLCLYIYLVAKNECKEDEEVCVCDLKAALGGRNNKDDVAKKNSGQKKEAQ